MFVARGCSTDLLTVRTVPTLKRNGVRILVENGGRNLVLLRESILQRLQRRAVDQVGDGQLRPVPAPGAFACLHHRYSLVLPAGDRLRPALLRRISAAADSAARCDVSIRRLSGGHARSRAPKIGGLDPQVKYPKAKCTRKPVVIAAGYGLAAQTTHIKGHVYPEYGGFWSGVRWMAHAASPPLATAMPIRYKQ